MSERHSTCPEMQQLIALIQDDNSLKNSKDIFQHVLKCKKCKNVLQKHCNAITDHYRRCSDNLLQTFMQKDSVKCWIALEKRIDEQVAYWEADVIAAAKKEPVRESIFFRSLAPSDSPYFWQAELILPMDEENTVRFLFADYEKKPVSGTFIFCNLHLNVPKGKCSASLSEFKQAFRNKEKQLALVFADGTVSQGVPLFFEEV